MTLGALESAWPEIESGVRCWACERCLGEPVLKAACFPTLEPRSCCGCGHVFAKGADALQVARELGRVLPQHFRPEGDGEHGGSSLIEIVGEAVQTTSAQLSRVIARYLEMGHAGRRDFFEPGLRYLPYEEDGAWEAATRQIGLDDWSCIAAELKHGRRFFNAQALGFFSRLVDEALDATDPMRGAQKVVVQELPAGTEFFRCRLAADEASARHIVANAASELGAAPKSKAGNNRMSPAGVPLIYLAKDMATAVAEVRPSLGDLAVVGRFRLRVPVKVFDFPALTEKLHHSPLSWFDPEHDERCRMRRLLAFVHDDIARPVRAADTDYVVTQALADFISQHAEGFQGIAFQSVQRGGGVNYVFFDQGSSTFKTDPSWSPSFPVEPCPDGVSVQRIKSVSYGHEPWEMTG